MTVDECINKVMAETERKIWNKTPVPYNTDAINRYMNIGCYSCRGYDKRCEYYDNNK